jgi:7-cyano-7-deazaguanine synthase
MVDLGTLLKEQLDVVILFSGGADSVLMLETALELEMSPFCVLIDYEQLHIEELNVACAYLNRKNIRWKIVKIRGLEINSGLTGDGIQGTYEGVHEMHVPSRNLMFVGIAASVAEDMGIDTVWYGADWSDYLNDFPDCKQEWLGRVSKVLEINGPKPMKLEAPLIGLTKENILKLLESAGVDMSQIFSGYGDL